MNKLDRLVLPAGDTLHVHQAGGVGTRNIFGTCGHVTGDLLFTHTDRHIGLFNGEHTTEATTLVLTVWLLHRDALLEFQQVDDLVIYGNMLLGRRGKSQLAHAVATVVDTYHVRKGARQRLHLYDVMKELDKVCRLT